VNLKVLGAEVAYSVTFVQNVPVSSCCLNPEKYQISIQHNLSHISNYNIFLEGTVSWEEETILAGLHHVSTLVTKCKVDSVPSSNI